MRDRKEIWKLGTEDQAGNLVAVLEGVLDIRDMLQADIEGRGKVEKASIDYHNATVRGIVELLQGIREGLRSLGGNPDVHELRVAGARVVESRFCGRPWDELKEAIGDLAGALDIPPGKEKEAVKFVQGDPAPGRPPR